MTLSCVFFGTVERRQTMMEERGVKILNPQSAKTYRRQLLTSSCLSSVTHFIICSFMTNRKYYFLVLVAK